MPEMWVLFRQKRRESDAGRWIRSLFVCGITLFLCHCFLIMREWTGRNTGE